MNIGTSLNHSGLMKLVQQSSEHYSYRRWPWLLSALLVPPVFLSVDSMLAHVWTKPGFTQLALRNVICHIPQFGILPFMAALIAIGFSAK